MKPHALSLAEFVCGSAYEDLSPQAVEALKVRIVDSLGCALGALDGAPVLKLREHLEDMGGRHHCTLVGGGLAPPDRAAFYNGTLIRYLDFNDSFHAPGETCHPSDNLAPVLAGAEYAGADGRTLLTALAVAYQVHCRLSEVAPVRDRGFDHVTQGAFSATAGACRAMEMDPENTAHALAIAGTANNALRVSRTGDLSHWKGLAFPNVAGAALRAALLAKGGITGPLEVFEGVKGWRESVSGDWELNWEDEDLEMVLKTDLKRYNAETHSQSAIEGLLELLDEKGIAGEEIRKIQVEVFDTAYLIIGGGKEGTKTDVRTKEQADHSLPYLLAVAALDREVLPRQYEPERIRRDDVQDLLRKVEVTPRDDLSRRFPREHPCRVTVLTKGGRSFTREKSSYKGFHDRPLPWEISMDKLLELGSARVNRSWLRELADVVENLEEAGMAAFTSLLSLGRRGTGPGTDGVETERAPGW